VFGSKPAQANSSRDPVLKNPSHKRAGGVGQGVGPRFKPHYSKKEKKMEERKIKVESIGK
jgi:hypothetical protein